MHDTISRQDAIDALMNDSDWADAIPTIKSLPSADRPTGEWINREKCQVDEDAYEVATCSECGAEITIEYPYDNYCPNCGADMSTRGIVKHEPI